MWPRLCLSSFLPYSLSPHFLGELSQLTAVNNQYANDSKVTVPSQISLQTPAVPVTSDSTCPDPRLASSTSQLLATPLPRLTLLSRALHWPSGILLALGHSKRPTILAKPTSSLSWTSLLVSLRPPGILSGCPLRCINQITSFLCSNPPVALYFTQSKSQTPPNGLPGPGLPSSPPPPPRGHSLHS